ncbi:hypothetical protein FOZ62_023185, partial [Perkinsus olseni]
DEDYDWDDRDARRRGRSRAAGGASGDHRDEDEEDNKDKKADEDERDDRAGWEGSNHTDSEGREVQNGTSDGETQPTMMKAQTVDEGGFLGGHSVFLMRDPNLTRFTQAMETADGDSSRYNTNNFFGKTREQCHETCDSRDALDVHGNSLPDAMFTNNDDPTLTCCICFNRYVVKTTTCDDD